MSTLNNEQNVMLNFYIDQYTQPNIQYITIYINKPGCVYSTIQIGDQPIPSNLINRAHRPNQILYINLIVDTLNYRQKKI